MWKGASERDAGGRQRSGMRRYRIFRPTDDQDWVILDTDFDSAKEADAFLEIMRRDVWPDPEEASRPRPPPEATRWMATREGQRGGCRLRRRPEHD